MPTYTANQLQENYPRCPHCACTDLADLIREEILSFEIFVELDDLKLQEVLVELMREGAPGLFLQQAPLSVREHVRENLSSYNRDRLDDDIRVTATDTERREAIDRAVRPAWVMQIRGDVKLKLPAARLSVVGMCPVCKRATIALENLQGLATCPRVPWDRSLRYTCAGHQPDGIHRVDVAGDGLGVHAALPQPRSRPITGGAVQVGQRGGIARDLGQVPAWFTDGCAG